MLALTLISNVVSPLNISDTVQKALDWMNEFKLYHLPLVNNSQFVGLIAADELVEIKNHQSQLENLSLPMLNSFVYNNAHLYDVIGVFKTFQLSAVPVLDQQKNYIGLITTNSLLTQIADMYALNEPGGIIVLDINNKDNSLAHIAQIVEADNAQILSSSVSALPNSTLLQVTLKLNRTEISGIIASFERYNFQVKAVYHNTAYNDYTDRFDSFMHYLNV